MNRLLLTLPWMLLLAACGGAPQRPAPIESRQLAPPPAPVVRTPPATVRAPQVNPEAPKVTALPEQNMPSMTAVPVPANLPAPQPLSNAAAVSSLAGLETPRPAALQTLVDEADAATGRKDPRKARDALERAIKLAPRDAGVWYRLASTSAAEGDWNQAGTLAERAVSLCPAGSPVLERARALQREAASHAH